MAVSEYHLDTRLRRRHVPLVSQQRRLRHLRSISARNISIEKKGACNDLNLAFTLHTELESPAFYTVKYYLMVLIHLGKILKVATFLKI
ncbi:UV radiation resistance associated protein [Caerostris extrusa]|uniref:UV radiation resistance associated protein n=1 Tax=Caerostris extrusa TaxID=172846 RepID=A0AAV4YCN7_CAEEX|nr:UV radiation resistance associated protein [Caerostris extrusa]